jgi:hypothetical protein
MAAAQKVSPATVPRIWKKHKLQPHRVESFKFSNDPQFTLKVRDIVGLYMNPPDKAIILSVNENVRFKRSSGRSQFSRYVPACPKDERTTTNATGRRRSTSASSAYGRSLPCRTTASLWHLEFCS